jgi:hypothetical protein
MPEVERKITNSNEKYVHRMQIHKPSMDIQKIEWDKRKKK